MITKNTDLSNQKIALVYDRVNKWGGAERVLLALHELFPDAPLYTAVYNPATAGWAKVFPKVVPSFLQKFPYATTNHELYPWLTPLAFESFDFSEFDLVISVTSADAKGIITKPHTKHICYCLTPTRYLWSHEDLYKSQTLKIFHPLFNYLKTWDKIAAQRPDAYIAISQTVQNRINKYYHRDSTVVYPPVDTDKFLAPDQNDYPTLTKDYFLYVSRLVSYKRADVVAEIFNDLKLPLKIIGLGKLGKKIEELASQNIQILGQLTDDELLFHYQNAKALVYFHEEDFGIIPVEAMSSGTPVIGLNKGGLSETVIHGITGVLIDQDDKNAFKNAILNFNHSDFDPQIISNHAKKFSKDRFQREFSQALVRLNSGRRRRH